MVHWLDVLATILLSGAIGMIISRLIISPPARPTPKRRPHCSDCGGVEPDCAGNCTGLP
jgi:hypothetical protein